LLCPSAAQAGNGRAWLSLLEATEAATYERRVVDESGRTLEREIFEVGSSGEHRIVQLEIVSFGEDGQPSKTTRVSWREGTLPPSHATDAAIRFGHGQVSIETEGPLLLYPKQVEEGGPLEDVRLSLKIIKGFLRILGTRTKLDVTGREVEPLPPPHGAAGGGVIPYRITSRIRARVFVLAIPVKRIEFETEECVEPSIGLIRHEIKLDDGTRVIMERIASRSAAAPSFAEARTRCGSKHPPSSVEAG
jgi:hypothetical protein